MLKTLSVASALAVGLGVAAYAHDRDDMPGPGWISFDQATQKLHALGYAEIIKLKAGDGFWKAKVVKDGATHKVRLDPRSGAVADRWRDNDD